MIIKHIELDRYAPKLDWDTREYNSDVSMNIIKHGQWIKYWDAYDLLEQARGWTQEDFDAVLLKMRIG